MNVRCGTFVLAFIICLCQVAAAGEESPPFDIPKLDGITIDGKVDDWGDRGFCVDVMTSADGRLLAAEDFDAAFRLGWNEEGLLVLVQVTDDKASEHPEAKEMWRRDSVELFLSAKRGKRQYYQVIIGPGMDQTFPEVRHHFYDHREKVTDEPLSVKLARAKTDTGYVLEVLMPWRHLGIEPKAGDEVGLQVMISDVDGLDDLDERFTLHWYPEPATFGDPGAVHRLRLSDRPGAHIRARAIHSGFKPIPRPRISVYAERDMAGKSVEICDGDKVLAKGKLSAGPGRPSTELDIPQPDPDKPYGELKVLVDGEDVASLNLSADMEIKFPKPADEMRMPFVREHPLKKPLLPKITSPLDKPCDVLTVATYTGEWQGLSDPNLVRVEVVAPGGKVLANKEVKDGEKADFATRDFPDGPYTIRVSKLNADGQRITCNLDWYKGNWLKQASEILDAADKLPPRPEEPKDLHLALLAEVVKYHLGGDPREPEGPAEKGPAGWTRCHGPLVEHAEWKIGRGGGDSSGRVPAPGVAG